MFRRSFPSRRQLALFAFFAGLALPVAAAADARVSRTYGQVPLHFEANQGQAHKDVRFLARGSGYSLYLTPGEAVFVLAKPDPDKKRDWHGKRDWRSKHERSKTEAVVLRMAIVGAHPAPLVSGLESLSGKVNYFIGNDPAKWRTNVPTYAKVHYRGVYPGIDLVYYGNQRQLEYDFVVAPGADPQNILLDFQGAERLDINAQGELVLHLAGSTLRQKKPVIYQEVNGIRREIAGGYVLQGVNRVGFQVAAHDRSLPLVIDPILSYSTFLGGGGFEASSGIAVDAAGNAYVTGRTSSANFPTTAGAFQTTCPVNTFDPTFCWEADVFVTKLNPTGSALVYSTYLGGNGGDDSTGIAVDAGGNAYVTGAAGISAIEFGIAVSDFPTTPGAFQTTFGGGGNDAFVTKLNPTGSALLYSTFLGGKNGDRGAEIAVDATGNAYVTGGAFSGFPTTAGAFQTTSDVGGAFVTKLSPTGSALVYSTYLGDSSGGSGIAVDNSGNVYVTGGTSSTDFPTTVGAFQPIYGGGRDDAFVTKLDSTGSMLVYSTYLGGDNPLLRTDDRRDSGLGIAVDADGSAYVTGMTNSVNFPITPGAFQLLYGGGDIDAFVTKLNPTGSFLVYSTFLGGSGYEAGIGVAVDAMGNAYVTGDTNSLNYPTTPGAPQATFGGGPSDPINGPPPDAWVTKLNPAGSGLVYSTYLGGSSVDFGQGIAVDNAGNAYVTGWASEGFPTTAGAFQTTGGDAFVTKIDNATTRSEESAATYVGSWRTFGSETGTFSGDTIVASNLAASSATFSFTGTALSWIGVKCNVCGTAIVSIDGGLPTMVSTAGPAAPGSLRSEVVFSASGLAPGVTHTLAITVTGTTSSGNTYIAVDAFDVADGSVMSPLPAFPALPLSPLIAR